MASKKIYDFLIKKGLKKNLKVKIRTYGYKKINFIIILSTSSNYFLKNFIFSVNTFSCSLLKLESTISG